MSKQVDIAIIGAGPGGLGAAANAAHHGVSHVLIEKNEIANTIYDYQLRKLVMAEPRRLPLRSHVNFVEGSREEVLADFDKALSEKKVNVEKGEVNSISKEGDRFVIKYSNQTLEAKNIVLAIGTMGTPRKLGVSGEEQPHIQYTLSDPDAFEDKDILVVGAGDSAIENVLGLSIKNRVSIINRRDEFPRAKDANRKKILSAIESGDVGCFYNATISSIDANTAVIATPDGDVTVNADLIIVRAGSIAPRKFMESCGIEYPSEDINSVPAVSDTYESNVKGLYIVGSLIGYPLIKQAINQGHEVVEHILGNSIEPADHVLIEEVLAPMRGDTNKNLDLVRESLPFFKDLSTPQFREMLIDSTVHVLKDGELVFEKNDFTDTFWSLVSGAATVEDPDNPKVSFTFQPGDFFGELGLISGRRRTATVRSTQGGTVLVETKRNQILKLMGSVPSVKAELDKVFLVRILKAKVFPEVDFGALDKLASKSKLAAFKKGDVICAEGDEGDSLFIILKGSVKISRKNENGVDVAQTYLPVGKYVGEMALLTGEPRSATVSAAVACQMAVITRDDFLEFLDEYPEVKQHTEELVQERNLKNITASQSEVEGEALDFMLQQGVSDAENVLLIDSDLCIACDNCEKACAATHGGYSRLDRKGGESFASIQIPVSCRHCENPLCMTDCPPDALERQPNGEVIIKETCIGCGNCESNCPYGVIQMIYEKPPKESWLSWFGFGKSEEPAEKGPAKAGKCDMCSNLEGGPACVRSCPTGAAMRMNPKEMTELLIGRQSREK